MSSSTKADTKAEKALKIAAKAVKKAQHAAEDASKKAQKKAKNLGQSLVEMKNDAATAKDSEPVSVTANAGTKSESGAVVTPPLPHTKAVPPTLALLREQAKLKKITGYSRLNKTALIKALK